MGGEMNVMLHPFMRAKPERGVEPCQSSPLVRIKTELFCLEPLPGVHHVPFGSREKNTIPPLDGSGHPDPHALRSSRFPRKTGRSDPGSSFGRQRPVDNLRIHPVVVSPSVPEPDVRLFGGQCFVPGEPGVEGVMAAGFPVEPGDEGGTKTIFTCRHTHSGRQISAAACLMPALQQEGCVAGSGTTSCREHLRALPPDPGGKFCRSGGPLHTELVGRGDPIEIKMMLQAIGCVGR